MRRALQTAIVLLSLFTVVSVCAQEWSVSADDGRSAKIVQRYVSLLEANPHRPMILRKLIEQTGRGPALGALIDRLRVRAASAGGADRWILVGHLLSAQSRPTEAIEAYRRAVELAPQDADAHAALGEALDETGSPDAALHFEIALEQSGTAGQKRKLLRRLADRSLYTGDVDGALPWLERLVDLAPNDIDLLRELAQAHRRVRRHDEALVLYRRALERAGRNGKLRAQLYRDIGATHHDLRDFVAAEESYRRALAVVGKRSWMRRELLMKLVDVARDAQRLPAMYDELTREWRHPRYVDTMTLAGLAEELGRHDDAVRWLERAIRLDRRAVEPRTRLIARLERSGDQERVGELFDELARMHPNDALKQLERIEWLYFRKEKTRDAMSELRALEDRFKDPVTQVEFARTWARFGLPDQALRVHEELLTQDPENPHNLEVYGELLHRIGREDASEEVLLRLLDTELGPLRARLRMADVYLRIGRIERAIEVLTWCVEKEPGMADVRQRLASAHERARQWEEASSHWEHLYIEDEIAHAGTRVVHIAEHTWDRELLSRWEAYYAENPSVRIGYVLGLVRIAVEGRLGTGPSLLAKIARKDPNALDSAEHAAWIGAVDETVRLAEKRSDVHTAIELLQRLAENFGDRRLGAWHQISELAFSPALSAKESEAWLQRSVRAVPNSAYVHAQYGAFLATQSRTEASVHHFRRAVRLGTTDFDVHLDLVHQLDTLDRPDEARAVLLDIIRRDRSGKWASGAAFSALDRCETDEQLMAFEKEIRRLQGRIPDETFRSIMVATYQQLFAYADDPAAAFAALGKRALPLLVEALQSQSNDARGRAMTLLNLYPPKVVAEAAGDAWNDAAQWQPEAVWVLARAGTESGRALVVHALTSDDPEVREIAIFAAGQQRVKGAVPILVETVRDRGRSFGERSLAAYALSHFDDATAEETLVAIANDEQAGALRRVAIWSLGKLPSERSTETLVGLLDARRESLRTAAAIALAQHRSEQSLRAQLTAVWGSNVTRRRAAQRTLQTGLLTDTFDVRPDLAEPIPELGELAVAAIEDSLQHPPTEPAIRRFAKTPELVSDIARSTLRDGSSRRVLDGLVSFASETPTEADGQAMRRVVVDLRPELLAMAKTREEQLVAPAARLLPIAEHPEDYPVVASAITRLPDDLAAPIYPAIANYDWSAIGPTVQRGIQSPDTASDERATHLRVLRRASPPTDAKTAKVLMKLTTDEHMEVRIGAIEALGAIGHDDATDELVAMFAESDEATRAAVVRSLEAMGTQRSRKAVIKLLTVPIRRPCRGDQEDLSDLLRDECLGVFDAAEF